MRFWTEGLFLVDYRQKKEDGRIVHLERKGLSEFLLIRLPSLIFYVQYLTADMSLLSCLK